MGVNRIGKVWSSSGTDDLPVESSGDSLVWQTANGGGFDVDETDFEHALSREINLRDHLLGQLNVDLPDPADRIIGLHLINLLDQAGYIAGELGQVAETLGCAPALVEATLKNLQAFDPPEIFARDLAECLTLQFRDQGRLDPAVRALVENLDLVGKRDFDSLRRICEVDADELSDMVAEIRRLNPKPGTQFDYEVAMIVGVHESTVRRVTNNKFIVTPRGVYEPK